MKLPIKYGRRIDLFNVAEVLYMFTNKIDAAVKKLTKDRVQFHSKNHLIQLVTSHSGMFMCTESFRDVETYLGENIGVLLRDYGVNHE
ncbi:hypothetical protein [Pseudomonas silesiensis]